MGGNVKKKSFLLNHRKSSAFVVSVLIHAAFGIAALTLVAVKVYVKPEQTFEVKEIHRPKLKLRKLQVPVKEHRKTQAPKLRHNIVAKPRLKNVAITMPEIVGVPGGLGAAGEGLGGLGFNFDMDLFGSNSKGSGNEFVGHFYDLKQTRKGELSEIGELFAKANGNWKDPNFHESTGQYRAALSRFLNGWNASRLDDYFMAPREKFASSFMIPLIRAEEAPKAFGVQDQVKPMEWAALYRGQISAPESGKYRFVGMGDDILVVRVKKKIVIDASLTRISDWVSRDSNSRKYQSCEKGVRLEIGDWFYLEKGKPTSMEVLIGEEPGGYFFCELYIQKEGVKYPTSTETFENPDTKETTTLQRPIIQVFKTANIPDELAKEMKINPGWGTLEGPSFGIMD